MRAFVLSMLVFSLACCARKSIYHQDIEQCNSQPEVSWCKQACELDSKQAWCGK